MAKRHREHAVKALEGGHRVGLGLDGVEAVAHRQLELGVGGDFRLVGVAADMGIRVIGERAHGGERKLLAAIVDQQRRVELVAKLGEGLAAGELHLQHGPLDGLGQHVRGGLRASAQEEGVFRKHGVAFDERVEVLDRGDIAAEGVVHLLDGDARAHQRGHRGVGSLILRVAGERQVDHQANMLYGRVELLELRDQAAQLFGRMLCRCGDGVEDGLRALGQRGEIGGKGRVVKAAIEDGKIPVGFHCISSLKCSPGLYRFASLPIIAKCGGADKGTGNKKRKSSQIPLSKQGGLHYNGCKVFPLCKSLTRRIWT